MFGEWAKASSNRLSSLLSAFDAIFEVRIGRLRSCLSYSRLRLSPRHDFGPIPARLIDWSPIITLQNDEKLLLVLFIYSLATPSQTLRFSCRSDINLSKSSASNLTASALLSCTAIWTMLRISLPLNPFPARARDSRSDSDAEKCAFSRLNQMDFLC